MDLNDLIKRIGIKPTNKRNEALDTYIENSDKKREKLETLLSEFLRIKSDESAPTFWGAWWWGAGAEDYYNYLDKNINNFDLADVTQLTGNEQLYKIAKGDHKENSKFGLFLSALINENIKEGERVQIITSIPIHCLFYKLENPEAYVNIAGDFLGYLAKRSKIQADEVRDDAGKNIESCELHVKKAGVFLGHGAKNSKIYADEVGDFAGNGIDSCELHVKKAGNWLGYGAENSKIYAEEAGNLAGYDMKNSKLFIYKLNGNLADSCFEGNNEIYLGEESYKEFIQGYPKDINKVKLWEKQN
ncbi:hypothetical protein IG206_02100 [Candidatus Parvarchaeota archaeon]|nr:hypothetical protein [Candidatus Acidifodinimicrobium mancum]